MNTMNCFQCVLKHISTALSYGKEIISGHGKGSDLDHRIDFLGQITNLEQHLELIDKSIFFEVKNFREQIQSKSVAVDETDLQYLRQLYLKVENVHDSKVNTTQHKETQIDSVPNILFLHIKNKDFFDLCYKMLQQNLTDYNKIYYLQSDIDLSGYDVEKIEYEKIDSQYIYIMNEKSIVLKQHSCKAKLTIADTEKDFQYHTIASIVRKNQPYFYYENYPVLVNKSEFENCLSNSHPLTLYFNQNKSEFEYKQFQVAIKLDKKLCCSNKARIKSAIFCYLYNDLALESLKEYLKVD